MDRRTVIAIAHRVSTIARMDRLVVPDRSRVVETGTRGGAGAHRAFEAAALRSVRDEG